MEPGRAHWFAGLRTDGLAANADGKGRFRSPQLITRVRVGGIPGRSGKATSRRPRLDLVTDLPASYSRWYENTDGKAAERPRTISPTSIGLASARGGYGR